MDEELDEIGDNLEKIDNHLVVIGKRLAEIRASLQRLAACVHTPANNFSFLFTYGDGRDQQPR